MKILITEILEQSDNKLKAVMKVDALTIETDIIEYPEPIRSFNLSNMAFQDVLEMAGLMTRFLRDFWRYKDNAGKTFPWDYGDHEAEEIKKALKHHKLMG